MINRPLGFDFKKYKKDTFDMQAWLAKWEPYKEFFDAERGRENAKTFYWPERQDKEYIFVFEPLGPEQMNAMKAYDEFEDDSNASENL